MKPILFNTEMVKAILDGRKTVTRRLVKPKYRKDEGGFQVCTNKATGERWVEKCDWDEGSFDNPRYVKPPYQSGDVLYVRETVFQAVGRTLTVSGETERYFVPIFEYLADGNHTKGHWQDERQYYWMSKRPAIHMPKEAARLFLRVTSIRVERLWDITEEQALKEGFYKGMKFSKLGSTAHTARQAFMWWWQRQYDNGLYSWASNPWVWVTEFEQIPEYKAILKEI
jgi:hypothetical protein